MVIDSPIISGSLILTGSAAFTGSLTLSGSMTTVGTITATTLVVQTITSSISSITGSTSFGSSSINNHNFTGSLIVSGAMFVSASGNVGIGTITPAKVLEVYSSANINTAQIKVGDAGSTVRAYLGTFSNNLYLTAGGTYSSGWTTDGTNGIANIVMEATNGGSSIAFGTAASNTSPTERMRITTSGSLLVGSTTAKWPGIKGVELNAAETIYGMANGANALGYVYHNGTHMYVSNEVIGSADMIFNVNGAARMRITSAGNVGIGGTPISSTGQLQVFGNDGVRIVNSGAEYRQLYHYAGGTLYFYNGTNQAYLTSGGVWTNASDISIKKDIIDINYGLQDVLDLKPRWYRMKEDDTEQIGFIAQEVEEVIKEVVMTDNLGMKGLSYGNLTAVLVKAIQELNTKFEEYKATHP